VDAEGGDDEEGAGDDGQHVSDDGRPVAPAEVDAHVVVRRVVVAPATEQRRRVGRVRLGVVRVSRGGGTERRHGPELDQSCTSQPTRVQPRLAL